MRGLSIETNVLSMMRQAKGDPAKIASETTPSATPTKLELLCHAERWLAERNMATEIESLNALAARSGQILSLGAAFGTLIFGSTVYAALPEISKLHWQYQALCGAWILASLTTTVLSASYALASITPSEMAGLPLVENFPKESWESISDVNPGPQVDRLISKIMHQQIKVNRPEVNERYRRLRMSIKFLKLSVLFASSFIFLLFIFKIVGSQLINDGQQSGPARSTSISGSAAGDGDNREFHPRSRSAGVSAAPVGDKERHGKLPHN